MRRRAVLAGLLMAAAPASVIVAAVAGPQQQVVHQTPAADPPTVTSVASMLEQFHWGMSKADVVQMMNKNGGLLDLDYNSQLARMQPGVAMQAVEAERDQKKKFFEQSYVQFADTPTGFDSTHIKGEFSYRNHEAVMYVDRGGKRRYFFFIGNSPGERLWKIYDDIPLRQGGIMGATYQEAVTKLNQQFNTAARIRGANPMASLPYTTADWQDGFTHLRAMDMSSDNAVAVVMEERNTLANLATLRVNKEVDPLALDPSISAITNHQISDPNAARAQQQAADAGRRH